MKLFDAELKIMEALWQEGEVTAKRLAEIMKERTGWSKTTTYTMVKRCIEKGACGRSEPNFVCRPLVSAREVREYETNELINRMYGGAADRLVACLLEGKTLSPEETERLKKLVRDLSETGSK